jgi:hypothetical protein
MFSAEARVDSYIANLLRRGAGLAPVISPRPRESVEEAFELEEVEAAGGAVEKAPRKEGSRGVEIPLANAREKRVMPAVPLLAEAAVRPTLEGAAALRAAGQAEAPAPPKLQAKAPAPRMRQAVAHVSTPPVLEEPAKNVEAPHAAPAVEPARAVTRAPLAPLAQAPARPQPVAGSREFPGSPRALHVQIGRIEITQAPQPLEPSPFPKREPFRFEENSPARRFLNRRWY